MLLLLKERYKAIRIKVYVQMITIYFETSIPGKKLFLVLKEKKISDLKKRDKTYIFDFALFFRMQKWLVIYLFVVVPATFSK